MVTSQNSMYALRRAWVMGRSVARHGRPSKVVRFWGGLGDHLLCSTLFHEWALRGERRAWMYSNYEELFRYNPDLPVVLREDEWYLRVAERLGAQIIHPVYAPFTPDHEAVVPPKRSILREMCEQAGIHGPITLKPYFVLQPYERQDGVVGKRQICIQSSCLSAQYPILPKEWFPERFQAVVDTLRKDYTFVQLGSTSDPPLDGVVDRRGTATLRETAALLSNSLAYVGLVGFLMHLARAVDCRSVIVYGGREAPQQSGYSCNENLTSKEDCSPCWRWKTCLKNRDCMRAITPPMVVDAIERQVRRYGSELPVDKDEIT